MLDSDLLTQIRADVEAIIGDNPASIQFTRGGVKLDAQTVRVERRGATALPFDSASGREFRGQIIVIGETGLDIQAGDQFIFDGRLCKVRQVRPNRQAATLAEAELVD